LVEKALVKTARPRHFPFIETVDSLASDRSVQETLKFAPPILVSTIPVPRQLPAKDRKNPVSDAFAVSGRQDSENMAAIRATRMKAFPVKRSLEPMMGPIVPTSLSR
jgi:hypothetical protein